MGVKSTIISTTLALALATTFTACGGSTSVVSPEDTKKSNPGGGSQTEPDKEAQSIVNGIVDLGTANLQTKGRALSTRAGVNCGTSASVQLYDIEDVDYQEPLLKEPIAINTNDCRFDIIAANFIDASKAGINGRYIIRSVVQDGNRKIELAAAKLAEGKDAGSVDPVATLIKAKFAETIKETKESLEKLQDLGVSQEAIAESIEKIVASFEENLQSTIESVKKDIEDGKIKIRQEDFETRQGIGEHEDDEAKREREAKERRQREQLRGSSASDSFEMLDNVLKKERLDRVVITPKDLKGKLTEGVAKLKYGVIESFVKLGLPVHDGQGNLIVFMPINIDKQGELPGEIFSLKFYDQDGELAGSVGDDFAIRVINPERDLAKATGNEEWFWSLNENDPKIPNSVIDTIILNKDHKITLETLGKKLNSISGGDAEEDGLTKLYGVVLSANIDTSAKRIFDVYKTEFIKEGFDRALWDQVDRMFRNFDGQLDQDEITKAFLKTPFIVKDGETNENFKERIIRNRNVIGPIADKIGSALVNGIPSEDKDPNVLQFKENFEINPNAKVKPLAALALINLYMETQGYWDEMVFTKKDLNEQFGWMLPPESHTFDNKQIWMLDFNPLGTNAVEDENSLSEEAEENRRVVIELVKTVTGVDKIGVERKYNDMVKSFHSIIKKIEKKRQESSASMFGNSFKGDMVQFDPDEESKEASVEFSVVNFDNQSVGDLDLLLVPMFEDTTSYMWVPMENQAVRVEFADGRYSAGSLRVVNPDFRFNDNGDVDPDGRFRATGEYDIWVIDGENQFPIASFPVFPGENNLNIPFYYDNTIDYGAAPQMPLDGGMQPGIPGTIPPANVQFESYFLDSTRDIFIPFVMKNDGERVGENILHFDAASGKFTIAEKRGVLQDSAITMTIINKDYNNPPLPKNVTEMTIGDDIGEGAMITLRLEGSQIQTQSIDMFVNYIGDDGIAVDFVGQDGMQDNQNMMEMVRDRFYREGNFVAEFSNAQPVNGTVDMLEFSDDDMVFGGVHYSYMYDDFDSVTMMKQSNDGEPEFVIFRFVKEDIHSAIDITADMIVGKELLLDDEYMAQKFIFNADGTVNTVMRDKMYQGASQPESITGHWSIQNNAVLISNEMFGDISLVIIGDNDGVFGEGDHAIFAFIDNGVIHPASPEQNVLYLGEPRDDENSFSYIVYPDNPEVGDGEDGVTPPPPPPSDQYPPSDIDMIELLGGQSFYTVYQEDGQIVIERVGFNENLSTISFEGIEGSDETGTDDITIEGNTIIDSDGYHTVIEIHEDSILIESYDNETGYVERSSLYPTLELAREEVGRRTQP